MEVTKLDLNQIETFRKKVNENWAVYHIYRNYKGKDLWGVICSAMDWITVGVSGIDLSSLSAENSNDASKKMMLFLSCIDVMWEGISQLYRVFYESKNIPMSDDHTVFNQKKTDNDYFKDIRAIFMAHPVNLRDIYGKSDKWFASWSGGEYSKKNFSVFLYSDVPGQKSIEFPISFSELIDFANRRYILLSEFMLKIDENVKKYNLNWQNKRIPTSENPLKHIEILIEESKQRWTNDYIDSRLEYLFDVFLLKPTIAKNQIILNEYRNALFHEISEIHEMLQNIDYDHDLNKISLNIPANLLYPYEKLHDNEPVMNNYGIESFRPYVSDLVDLDDFVSMEGIQFLIDAALWKKSL